MLSVKIWLSAFFLFCLRTSPAHCCLAVFLPISANPDGSKNVTSFHLFVDFLPVSGTPERNTSHLSRALLFSILLPSFFFYRKENVRSISPPLFSEASLMPVPFCLGIPCAEASEGSMRFSLCPIWDEYIEASDNVMAEDQLFSYNFWKISICECIIRAERKITWEIICTIWKVFHLTEALMRSKSNC